MKRTATLAALLALLPAAHAQDLTGLSWRSLGPTVTTGRIADIAIDPKTPSTWYVASAIGGLWKTLDRGASWTPIFDSYSSFSMGCVTVDPKDSNTVWLGTGENLSQRSVAFGDGVYKSTDAGKTWTRMGLEKSEHIAKVLIHPKDSKTVYVAAQGPLWAAGGDRGLYKTTDAGKTWERVLYISEDTGVTDVVMDPKDPKRLWAAAYQRRRHTGQLIGGGPEGAIYRSDNGGKSWKKLAKGLPDGNIGRIALAVSPQKTKVVYASVTTTGQKGGLFRSEDRGESWTKMSAFGATDAQYYGELIADPFQFDRLWAVDTNLQRTDDGGKTMQPQRWPIHVDYHAITFDPTNPNHLIVGNDGGLYETYDNGTTWKHFNNLPLSQFYRVVPDNATPFYNVYGGMQDNGTIGGPARSINRIGVRTSDWITVGGGDGFQARVDPTDPDTVYTMIQNGALSRLDKKTSQSTFIQPRNTGLTLRWNWDTPFIISPHAPSRLFIGANVLFRSDDKGTTWKAISGDLSRGIDRETLPIMGKIWNNEEAVTKNRSTTDFGILNALDESPKQEGLIYVGTDDGLIQVTEDGGKSWRKQDKFPGVPERATVSDVCPSQHSAEVVYASFHDFQHGDFTPYLLKSTDKGRTWTSIASNLPARSFVWTIAEDPVNPNLLFVGTEFGAYVSLDGGKKWVPLKDGIPTIQVRDLAIQAREGDLIAGTFGRGAYVLDDLTPLRNLAPEQLEQKAVLFPARPAYRYYENTMVRSAWGNVEAANPLFGAMVTYYVKAELKNKLQLRIFDKSETPLRMIEVPNNAGFHRAAWDLRPSALARTQVAPGTYTAVIGELDGDDFKPLTATITLTVKELPNAAR